MDIITNKIYATSDSTGTVVKLFSSVFETPQDGDILIEEGNEDYHAHVHLKYQLVDEYGRYNYRIANDNLEEIIGKPPISEPPKSEIEILKETVDTLVLSQLGVL